MVTGRTRRWPHRGADAGCVVVLGGWVAHRASLTVAELPGPDRKGLEMTLIVLSVVVIALFIAVLAIFLFTIGGLLNRTAGNLDDCLQNVQTIAAQAEVIGPAIEHINRAGGELAGALPLLYEAAERIGDEPTAPANTPSGLGYMDA